mmetsp:Transcript_18989/g.72492  ORF Transcript_18989/g.72492 Transcript_18989/m.72492 type:complete len:229 (+) Transcript_18989:384-1070(+)
MRQSVHTMSRRRRCRAAEAIPRGRLSSSMASMPGSPSAPPLPSRSAALGDGNFPSLLPNTDVRAIALLLLRNAGAWSGELAGKTALLGAEGGTDWASVLDSAASPSGGDVSYSTAPPFAPSTLELHSSASLPKPAWPSAAWLHSRPRRLRSRHRPSLWESLSSTTRHAARLPRSPNSPSNESAAAPQRPDEESDRAGVEGVVSAPEDGNAVEGMLWMLPQVAPSSGAR